MWERAPNGAVDVNHPEGDRAALPPHCGHDSWRAHVGAVPEAGFLEIEKAKAMNQVLTTENKLVFFFFSLYFKKLWKSLDKKAGGKGGKILELGTTSWDGCTDCVRDHEPGVCSSTDFSRQAREQHALQTVWDGRAESPARVGGHTLTNSTDPSPHLRRAPQFSSLSRVYKKLLLLSAGLLADFYVHHLPKGVSSSSDLFKLL